MLYISNKVVSTDEVIPWTRLEEAIDDVYVRIRSNLTIAVDLYEKHPEAIMFVNLAYEETGRYVKYVQAYCDKKGITRDDMKQLHNHKYKLDISVNYIFEQLEKIESIESINKSTNTSFRGMDNYKHWLDNAKKSYGWLKILPKIKELALYPSWWEPESFGPIDLTVLLHRHDLNVLIEVLFYECNFYSTWLTTLPWQFCKHDHRIPSDNNLQQEIAHRNKIKNDSVEMEKIDLAGSIITFLGHIYDAVNSGHYSDESKQIFAQLRKRKKTLEQTINVK